MPEQTPEPAATPEPTVEQVRALREAFKAKAVNESMLEILQENRAEVVKRARAKLMQFGIPLSPDEVRGF